MNKPITNLGINDDYATMYTQGRVSWEEDDGKISFYYGYEVTEDNDEDGEWMFVAKRNGRVLKAYTTSELEANTEANLGGMESYLLVGINMYINGL